MLRFALALVRCWTTLYTSGMPDSLRAARRAEIDSDLWESQHDRRPEPDFGVAAQVLFRLIRGVPDDLLWRVELIDLRSRRRRTGLWLTAAAGILLPISLWVGSAMTPAQLPQPPHPMIFVGAPPPPPPPPEPPGAARGPFSAPPPPPAPAPASSVILGGPPQ